jgi:hypothetical protein
VNSYIVLCGEFSITDEDNYRVLGKGEQFGPRNFLIPDEISPFSVRGIGSASNTLVCFTSDSLKKVMEEKYTLGDVGLLRNYLTAGQLQCFESKVGKARYPKGGFEIN